MPNSAQDDSDEGGAPGFPSGAKAIGFIGHFAAVRVKTLTYQSCPDTKLAIDLPISTISNRQSF
jgi:hypothetical protein